MWCVHASKSREIHLFASLRNQWDQPSRNSSLGWLTYAQATGRRSPPANRPEAASVLLTLMICNSWLIIMHRFCPKIQGENSAQWVKFPQNVPDFQRAKRAKLTLFRYILPIICDFLRFLPTVQWSNFGLIWFFPTEKWEEAFYFSQPSKQRDAFSRLWKHQQAFQFQWKGV